MVRKKMIPINRLKNKPFSIASGNSNFDQFRGNHGELPCSFYKYGKYLPIIGDFRGVGAGLRARPVKISFS